MKQTLPRQSATTAEQLKQLDLTVIGISNLKSQQQPKPLLKQNTLINRLKSKNENDELRKQVSFQCFESAKKENIEDKKTKIDGWLN